MHGVMEHGISPGMLLCNKDLEVNKNGMNSTTQVYFESLTRVVCEEIARMKEQSRVLEKNTFDERYSRECTKLKYLEQISSELCMYGQFKVIRDFWLPEDSDKE